MAIRVGVMQPYIFPYLGYFQLINAVDYFVFYDDVNFIKRGWINRNKILLDGKEKLITFPCKKASQNKLINEIQIDLTDKNYSKLLSTIKQAYSNENNFKDIFPLIEEVLTSNSQTISDLAIKSIQTVSDYLDIETEFLISSKSFEKLEIDKADRLISIAKQLGGKYYINAIGGQQLYDKKYFKNHDVELSFLEPQLSPYPQNQEEFIPGLSIIDILMFNSKDIVKEMVTNFKLV